MGRIFASDGSALEWEIARTPKSGFSAILRIVPPGANSVEAEAYKSLFASREDAVAWLSANARARGFDAGEIS
jgi:hypothetical protein